MSWVIFSIYIKAILLSIISGGEPGMGKRAGEQYIYPKVENLSDTFFTRQWAIDNNGTFDLTYSKPRADINILPGWEITRGDSNIIVAVLDGGVNRNEPDLEGRFWNNENEIPGNNIDDDGNGYVDDIYGWDFVENDNDPQDIEGHGTNVAGIIAARPDNKIGYTGIDWNCRLLICRITDESGNGYYYNWAKAIRYAVDQGARVINMSVGGVNPSPEMQDAIDYAHSKKVIVVAAMMNTNTSKPYYPAASRNVIAVGSTNPDDTRSAPFFWSKKSGSNFGNHLTVVAPGNYIFGLSAKGYNTYWGGTSQAAPYVTGLISLMLSLDQSLDADKVRRILAYSSDDQVGDPAEDRPGWDPYYGFGRVNAFKALKMCSRN